MCTNTAIGSQIHSLVFSFSGWGNWDFLLDSTPEVLRGGDKANGDVIFLVPLRPASQHFPLNDQSMVQEL